MSETARERDLEDVLRAALSTTYQENSEYTMCTYCYRTDADFPNEDKFVHVENFWVGRAERLLEEKKK